MDNTKAKRHFATFYYLDRYNRLETNTIEVYGVGISAVTIPEECFYIKLFSLDAGLKISNMGRLDRRTTQDVETWVISDRCARAIGRVKDSREQMGLYAFKNSPNAISSADIKGGRYVPKKISTNEAGADE